MTTPVYGEIQEHELIARSVAGDRVAFGALVGRYQRLAIQIAYRMTGDALLAEDLAQEAFIKIWLNLSRFRGQSSFRTWLARIVTNATIDYLRRSRPSVELEDHAMAASAATSPSPASRAIRKELQEEVRNAILSLPVQSRAALILREYEGLSYREIAETLGIPIGTVMSRLNYARSRLKELLTGKIELESTATNFIRPVETDVALSERG